MEIITKDAHKALLKRMLHNGAAPDFVRISAELAAEAEIRMRNPLYSVTFTKSRAVSGNPHDFYTEAPYWWPDPANPGGPFIRRDGYRFFALPSHLGAPCMLEGYFPAQSLQ